MGAPEKPKAPYRGVCGKCDELNDYIQYLEGCLSRKREGQAEYLDGLIAGHERKIKSLKEQMLQKDRKLEKGNKLIDDWENRYNKANLWGSKESIRADKAGKKIDSLKRYLSLAMIAKRAAKAWKALAKELWNEIGDLNDKLDEYESLYGELP